jgi:hypothetical protein
MALTHGPTNTYTNIVTSGLVLNLDASNISSYPGSGTTWNDLSSVMGNVNIQNRSADWTFTTDPTTGVKCISNATNRTNASTPGINIPMNNGFNRAAGTVDFWIKPLGDYVGGHGYFVNADGVSNTNASGWLWFGTWDLSQYVYLRQGNPSSCCNDSALGTWDRDYYFLNSWMNLSFTWNVSGGTQAIYKNGILLTSRNNMPTDIPTTTLNATGQMFNGHIRDDNMQFKGYCNNYRIYNRSLSAAEIKQNFSFLSQRFK